MVREGERAPSVTLATVVGLLTTLWIALEVAFPH
jgi:hypothetical protein